MKIINIETCRGCGAKSKSDQWSLKMAPIPMVGKLYDDQESALAQPSIPLTWTSCHNCGLLQVEQDVEDDSIYRKYNYSSSSFIGLQNHFITLASAIDEELSGRRGATFLEIGCNDGILIKRVSNAKEKIGVDPSDIAKNSHDGSYELINDFFSNAMDTPMEKESVDVVATSNSFAHFTDIGGAIEEIHRILKPDGILYVEVHDGDLLLDESQWDTIYHEHKVEWTEHASAVCFGKYGLQIISIEKLPMHGGTIRIKFIKGESEKASQRAQILANNLEGFETSFNNRHDNAVAERLSQLESFCCYGASGRAVNWLYQMGLQGKVQYLFDDSSERVGKFLGHSGIEILEGGRVGEIDVPVVITAWNFSEKIRTKHKDKNVEWLQYYEWQGLGPDSAK